MEGGRETRDAREGGGRRLGRDEGKREGGGGGGGEERVKGT